MMNLRRSTGPPYEVAEGEDGQVSQARPPSPPSRTGADAPAERGPPAFWRRFPQPSATPVGVMIVDAVGEKRGGAVEEAV